MNSSRWKEINNYIKHLKRNGIIYVVSKIVSTKYLLTTKTKSNFIVMKHDKCLYDQEIKVNIISNWSNKNPVPSNRMQWGENSIGKKTASFLRYSCQRYIT